MSQLLARAASCCRLTPRLTTSAPYQLPLRFSSPSQNQTALLSFHTNPQKANPNPNAAFKIPPHKRPLNREPTPPPTKTPEELTNLAYLVRRTPSIQLPVYRRWMSGGNRQVILIKKVDGDRRKLMDDLVNDLGIVRPDIRINPTTQHIEIKGDYFTQARSWLIERGF